jgi:hypothetical protein
MRETPTRDSSFANNGIPSSDFSYGGHFMSKSQAFLFHTWDLLAEHLQPNLCYVAAVFS